MREGYTACILENPFFQDLDLDELRAGAVVPMYVPAPSMQRGAMSLLVEKRFEGDSAIFASF